MVRSSFTLSEVWVLRFFVGALVMFVATVSDTQAQKQVNFCSLFDPANQGRIVTSTALMFHSTVGRVDGGDTFLYSADCNGPDFFAIPEAKPHVWSKWTDFYRKLPAEKNLVLEIKFEGKSEVANAYLFGSLTGWARAQVTLSKIISIRDVTETRGTLANSDAPKPETERIEAMRGLLDVFLTPLSVPINGKQNLLSLMSDDFRFVDLSGKVYGKNQYENLNLPLVQASTGIKESSTRRKLISSTKDMMKWRATFELIFKAGPPKTYYCDVTLVLQDDAWMLKEAKMLAKP